jgi:RNA polymerase sigma-70 factor (ECF subfamily)
MYEEKSTEQIASQVGLSENATRQLIFRARAAFKKALIGDIDTTGMSAAAILSVAARKAASEGKKVGAAALTLIALVVMSLTVFPGLNRATTDQMAEAPVNPGSSELPGQATGEVSGTEAEVTPTPDSEVVDDSGANAEAAANTSSSASTAKAKKDPSETVLDGSALSDILNADSRSMVFVLDQNYTAIGDNGLSAKFTFNPTSEAFFSGVFVEVELEDLMFAFKPSDPMLVSGKDEAGLDVFMFAGKVPTLVDESGKKWSETVAKGATFVIEMTMERNGTTVKEITLAMYRANS